MSEAFADGASQPADDSVASSGGADSVASSAGAVPSELQTGALHPLGRLSTASNLTLLCDIDGAEGIRAVYKPIRGEAPLWDFPDGTLAGREVAAYLISEALGWGIVPPTILRDGPVGPGMVQRWIELPGESSGDESPSDATTGSETTDEEGGPPAVLDPVDLCPAGEIPAGWIPILDALDHHDRPIVLVHADRPELRRMAVFDVVINNADRKGGHILTDSGRRIFGIDHGVSLHSRNKLRTVLWGWAGDEIDEATIGGVRRLIDRLDGGFGEQLLEHLTEAEIDALRARAAALVSTPIMPSPSSSHPIPWPAF